MLTGRLALMRSLVAALTLCAACSPSPEPAQEPAAAAPAPVPADQLATADAALTSAIAGANTSAALVLVDDDVTWTDAAGRTIGKAEMMREFPRPGIADESVAETTRFDYEQVGVVQVNKDRLHSLRIWVRRPAGWRLFVYHEVQALAAPPTAASGSHKECVNPCRTIPYEPTTEAERGVIAAYQALETAAHAADVANWGTHVADEFILASSNSDRTFTEAERLDGLRKATFGGITPTELMAAKLYEFGNVVVMRSQHRPASGLPLQISRVWINRDGVWQSTLSYQTSIQVPTQGS